MISPVDRPLELAPKSLKVVGVENSLDVFAFPVGNSPMRVTQGSNLPVAGEFVGRNNRTGFDVGLNQRPQGLALHVVNNLGANLAATFSHSKDCRFASRTAPALPFPLSSDVSLICLNNTFQDSTARLHHDPDLFGDSPSALIGYAKLALKLFGRYPVLGLSHKEDRMEPSGKACRTLMEDRPGCRVDLMPAPGTDEGPARGDRVIAILVMALGAFNSLWIFVLENRRQAGLIVGVVSAEVVDRVFHAHSIAGVLSVVKG